MLTEPALVLNKNWVPIQTTTVRNAICLLFSGAARAIDPETYMVLDFVGWRALEPGDYAIETVSDRIRIPDVILLSRYGKIPSRHVSFSRRNLYRRDAFTCQYCTRRLGASDATIDHVMPRSRGGRTSWENCVVSCGPCNRRKGDLTPQEARMPLAQPPRAPRWSPYLGLDGEDRKASWEAFIKKA